MVSCGKHDFQCEISIHTFSLISSTCMLLQCYNVFTRTFPPSHDAEKLHLRISSACEDITSRKIHDGLRFYHVDGIEKFQISLLHRPEKVLGIGTGMTSSVSLQF